LADHLRLLHFARAVRVLPGQLKTARLGLSLTDRAVNFVYACKKETERR
jgi:hypothetical protein